MKTKLFLLALVALLCIACEKKTQERSRQEVVSQVQLSPQTESDLNTIFNISNERLDISPFQVKIVRSNEELAQLCPDNISTPSLDFKNNCLIFTYLETHSISDEWVDIQLYNSNIKGSMDLVIYMQTCKDCYTSIGHFYPYGVFEISPIEINDVTLFVEEKK